MGDRQEQVGVIKFGLTKSIRCVPKTPLNQIRPSPAVVVKPTERRISRGNPVSPLKRLI